MLNSLFGLLLATTGKYESGKKIEWKKKHIPATSTQTQRLWEHFVRGLKPKKNMDCWKVNGKLFKVELLSMEYSKR